MLDDAVRTEIAKSLEDLAAQEKWNPKVWQRCYDLVRGNMKQDDLVAHVHDDLIHYTGRSLFSSAPRPKDFKRYCQEFRDIASAIRSHISLTDYKKNYE